MQENPVLRFMQANLADKIIKEYQDLFPSHGNTSSASDLTARVDALLNIMIKPAAGASYYVKGALCELSTALHYNGSYLNEIVQKHTGMCLFDYGMTFCFAKAEQLLLETDLPVSEIAAQLKFANRTHFF